jgi:hypothetical protein
VRPHHLACFLVALAAVAGCKKKQLAVPATPPPQTSPVVPAVAAVRPAYELNGRTVAAGTGFIVADKAGKCYFLSAAHVMDPLPEWRKIDSVTLAGLSYEPVGTALPSNLVWVGKPFDKAGAEDDLVIWEPTFPTPPAALPLAAEDPKRNEWVWVVGQEAGRRGQRLMRCKVTGTESGGITLEQHDPFKLQGFSGAPVVNAKGEVVAVVLGGRGTTAICSVVSTVRQRLADAGIQVP